MSATLDLRAAVSKLGELERMIFASHHADDAKPLIALMRAASEFIGRAMGAIDDARETALKTADKL